MIDHDAHGTCYDELSDAAAAEDAAGGDGHESWQNE